MTSPLGQFVMVTFRAAADTPAGQLPLDGQVFYFPPEYLSSVGSGPSSAGVIHAGGADIKGYMNVTAGPIYEWVMTSGLSAAALTVLNGIPPPPGWVDQTARQTYLTWGRTMRRDWGAPMQGISDALTALYNAAVANKIAQGN